MNIPQPKWRSPTGEIIACVEKLKVLRENLEEIQRLCQDALDDAVLMGCDERQFRSVLVDLIGRLKNTYGNQRESSDKNESA
ncbi:MAG: hypothetical protein HY661_05405 [Betaproteobacteria bacterium]|nr:hypothetical protein [Betaproteobacteria bacterium]